MKKTTQMKKAMNNGKKSADKMSMGMDKPMSMSHKNNSSAMCMCASCPSTCGAWGLTILRVIVGALFMLHGLGKFFTWKIVIGGGWAGTSGFFTQLFGAAGPFLAGLTGAVEILAGLAILVGIWTRWASYLLIVVLAVAVVWAKHFGFPSIETDLLYLGALFAIAWNGPGRWSLHETCDCCRA